MNDAHEAAGAVLALVNARTARYREFADTWPGLEGPRLAVELLAMLARAVELLARARGGESWRQAPIEWAFCSSTLETAAKLFETRTVAQAHA